VQIIFLKALRELAKKHPSVITIIRLGKYACLSWCSLHFRCKWVL